LGQSFASVPNRGEFGIYLGANSNSAFKVIQRGGPELMRVTRNGNIGIGTSTPQSALQVNGYIQLALTSGAPPSVDCVEIPEYGRMKVDAANNKLYVCTSTGWKTATLAP
jgi:hypothetical protein